MTIARTFSGLVAKATLKVLRYKAVGEAPDGASVVIAAPHTSYWDFPLSMAAIRLLGFNMKWLAKKSVFWGPAGPVLRHFGGIPVDRSSPQGLVDELKQLFADDPHLHLMIAASGTTLKAEYWKSGFYRVATGAGVPVTLAFVDGSTRSVGAGPTIPLTGDVHTDMDTIRAFYTTKTGVHAKRVAVPRLRAEDE